MHVKIGSRKSHLAQFQAYAVKDVLEKNNINVELYFRPSMGDLNLDMDLAKTQSKGVFTQDFFELIKEKKVDAVVHSWKDLPIEQNGVTEIAATLEREDTRDLFLVKKQALQKKTWTVLTSSPRREHNLSLFFDYLSDGEQSLKFKPIRGNIPTRFNKFLEDKEADAFCVAFAAVKRLLVWGDFNKDHPEIWKDIENSCHWAVLPESKCPSAPAQGALAIEVLSENKGLKTELEKINSNLDFMAVERERQILKKFGGGCHLAVGATCLNHAEGQLDFIVGKVDGKSFSEAHFRPKKKYPEAKVKEKIWISSEQMKAKREKRKLDVVKGSKSLLVSRYESFDESLYDKDLDVIQVAGVRTWKKLFKNGYWVSSCLDSMGQDLYIKSLFKTYDRHLWLTRKGVSAPDSFELIESYDLSLSFDPKSLIEKEYFIWMSGEAFQEALLAEPSIGAKKHFFGLGRSMQTAQKVIEEKKDLIKSGFEVFSFYDLDQLKKAIVQ